MIDERTEGIWMEVVVTFRQASYPAFSVFRKNGKL
jgi:hypothetical protein